MISYSLNELLNSADALIAPLRLGMMRHSINLSTNDPLETIERHLNNERDRTTAIQQNTDETQTKKKVFICFI